MFQLTSETGEIFYGLCVMKEEPIEYSPSFMDRRQFGEKDEKEEKRAKEQKQKQKPLPKLDCEYSETFQLPEGGEMTLTARLCTTNTDRTRRDRSQLSQHQVERRYIKASTHIIIPRCYCVVSKFPFFEFHLEVLQSILAIEQCYTISHVSLQPLEMTQDSQEALPVHEEITADQCKKSILKILEEYFQLQVPLHGRDLTFSIPEDATLQTVKNIRYDRPLSNETEDALCGKLY